MSTTGEDRRTGTATELLSGVDALARLLVLRARLDRDAGLDTATMVSGYPGSPLGTFDMTVESLGAALAEHRIVHRPGLNEELAATTVWGSQMGAAVPYSGVDGVVGVWYGKGPGVDRSGDSFKHANAMGSGPNGGVVMLCADDPLAKSSTLPCDSHQALADACVPVLYPSDAQDVVDLGIHAFAMSRFAGPWVALKIVTAVADGIGTVDMDPARHDRIAEPIQVDVAGRPWRHEPLPTIGPHQVPDQEILVVDHRLRAAQAYVRHHGLDRVTGAEPGAGLGIICAGRTYVELTQAFADLGVSPGDLAAAGVRILKLAMTFPVVPDTVVDFAGSVDTVLVLEDKRPFIEQQVRAALHEAGSIVPLIGKRDRDGEALVGLTGELDAARIRDVLTRVLPDLAAAAPSEPPKLLPILELPGRAPAFCSGCPHNRSTVAPDDALVGGGVGCHGIMYFEARNADMKRLPPVPMGSEGVPWIGLAPFVDEPHLIQNLGDGTLSHSGTLAIRAAVAADADMTFKILYNDAVAMTGGQDVVGLADVPALTRALEAEGVAEIVVCAAEPDRYGRDARFAPGVQVLDRGALAETQERLRTRPGVTVIIYDQICAAEARRMRRTGELDAPPARVVINEAVCEGCGDCGAKSNCLSVLPVPSEFGSKRQIHDPSCNRDYTCMEGDCPSFVTITPLDAQDGSAAPQLARPLPPAGDLPVPPVAPLGDQFGLYFTGIGGTGVVTANRILARAAQAAGWVVEGMDQTGLSQKAGAVVSHLHIAADRAHVGSPAVGTAGAHAYLSGDILQAAAPQHLDRVAPGQTIAVIDQRMSPSAAMLQGGANAPDEAALAEAITQRVGAERTFLLDPTRIAETVFGNHMLANIVLIGAACQAGALPFTLEQLDEAISANGRAGTLDAFTWGRWAVYAPDAVRDLLDDLESHGASAPLRDGYEPSDAALDTAASLTARLRERLPGPLGDLVQRRAAQVIDYQNTKLARRYLKLLADAVACCDDELIEAVAQGWFKVLTYKDEYEVARLHRRADYTAAARALGITGEVEVKYHLHPPVLRRMGLAKKLPMGRTYDAAFAALEKMKTLRGTPLDPFRFDPDRVQERQLIVDYERLVRDVVFDAALEHALRVDAAESVQEIKGYGPIKEAAIDQWRARFGLG